MHKNYTDKQRLDIAKQQYNSYNEADPVKIEESKKSIGIVSQKINNKSTGEQSYIITDKYTPPTASISERNKVKELTILYKGSTAPANGNFNVPKHPDYKDVRKDWLSNDIPTAIQITNGGGSTVTPQLKTSAETLKQTMKLYPNAQIYVYGHSLGSMNAQYAIADLDKKDIKRISGVSSTKARISTPT